MKNCAFNLVSTLIIRRSINNKNFYKNTKNYNPDNYQQIYYFILFISIILSNSLFFVSACSPKNNQSAQEEIVEQNVTSEIAKLNKQIEANPDNHVLYYERALSYIENKKPYEALSDINKALQLDPQNTEYQIVLADIYFSMGHLDNCRKTLITAADNDPSNVEPVLKLAELDLILKDYEKMELYINKTLQIDKVNAQAYFMLATAKKEQGDTVKALQLLTKATSLDPDYYDAYVEAGLLNLHLNIPIAEDFLKTAINLRPSGIEARYALAMFYQNNEKLEQSIAEYNIILEIDPQNYKAFFNLGYIHLIEYERYDEAIKFFTQAINTNPSYAEAYYNRGFSYELKGDKDAAQKNYRKALQIKENYSLAIDGLNRIEK